MNCPVLLPAQSHADNDEMLGQQITLLAGQINAANQRLLQLIAEFDRRKAWSGGGTVRSCAHWLNWKCGIALGAAREKVRVARSLEKLPLIDASFANGEISYSKVRAMTRVATPANEDFLLRIAEHGTASHVEKVVGKYKHLRHSDENAAERDQDNERKLVYYQDQDGMWVIHARLPPEAGSLVIKAIEAVAKPVQSKVQSRLQEPQQNVSAETVSDAVTQEEPAGFQALLEHTRADALATVAEHFLATAGQDSRFEGLKGSERCQVMLHVDIRTLRERDQAGNTAHTPSGRTIETSYFPQFPDVSAETSGEELNRIAPAVGSRACVSRWKGEDCDYGMAIDALLTRDGLDGVPRQPAADPQNGISSSPKSEGVGK